MRTSSECGVGRLVNLANKAISAVSALLCAKASQVAYAVRRSRLKSAACARHRV